MVGVPGKSKACNNCRKRRVQCDRKQPSCGQCQRSQITCGGYHKEFIFLNSTFQESQDGSTSFEQKSYSIRNKPNKASPAASARSRATAAARPATIVLQECLECSAYKEKIVGEFWTSYLPNGRAASKEATKYSTYGWTRVAQDLYTKDPMVRVGLLANAMGLISQLKNDSRMFQMSRQLYGRSLLAVEKALRDPGKHGVHTMLTALRLVSFYELWFGSDGDASAAHFQRWMTHTSGNVAYLLMNDPQTYSEGHAQELFSESRLPLVALAVLTRKATPLARREWKTVPWSKKRKTPMDTLIDIMTELPGMHEDVDRINLLESGEQQAKARAQLRDKCYKLHEESQAWAKADGKTALELAESVMKQQRPESASRVRPSEEFAKGHLVMLHFAVRIIIYHTLRSHTGSDVEALPQYVDPLLYCRKLGNFLPFFLVPNGGSVFFNMAILPLTVALSFLNMEEKTEQSTEKLLLLRAFRGHVGKAASMLLISYQASQKLVGRPILE